MNKIFFLLPALFFTSFIAASEWKKVRRIENEQLIVYFVSITESISTSADYHKKTGEYTASTTTNGGDLSYEEEESKSLFKKLEQRYQAEQKAKANTTSDTQ